MKLDLGDVTLGIDLRVRGLQRFGIRWRVGVPVDSVESDRELRHPPYAAPSKRKDFYMDLQADKKVPLSLQWTDEVGNPVPMPVGATVVYSVDDPLVVSLTDHGDGTAEVAATGVLGQASVHVEATSNGFTATGDLQVNVVAGNAERVQIVAGPPEEVTPDV